MSAVLAPGIAVLTGAALWRAAGARGLPAVATIPLAGTLALGVWMEALALLGLRWTPLLLAAPAAVSLVLALRRGRPATAIRRPDAAALTALVGTVPAVALAAWVPAFGWDFRYIWGLKARVFAMAGGHPAEWLTWPGHAFAHPGYPPLWSDLLAAGVVLGGRVATVAAAWDALLVAALAAACWWAAEGASRGMRALAAIVGAWAPVIGGAAYSGYAEPLLAVGLAAGLGGLRRAGAAGPDVVAACGLAVAAMTKDEGTVLAIAAIAGTLLGAGRGGRSARLLLALAPALAWRIWAAVVGVAAPETLSLPGRIAREPLSGLTTSTARPVLTVIVELTIWCLVLPWLGGRANRPLRFAIAGWAAAAAAVYLIGAGGLGWRLATSLDRVLAAPLPALLAVTLATAAAAPGRQPTGPAGAEPG